MYYDMVAQVIKGGVMFISTGLKRLGCVLIAYETRFFEINIEKNSKTKTRQPWSTLSVSSISAPVGFQGCHSYY